MMLCTRHQKYHRQYAHERHILPTSGSCGACSQGRQVIQLGVHRPRLETHGLATALSDHVVIVGVVKGMALTLLMLMDLAVFELGQVRPARQRLSIPGQQAMLVSGLSKAYCFP